MKWEKDVDDLNLPTGSIYVQLFADPAHLPDPDPGPEVDPLDELLDAAGIGKEAGLPKRRTYIERTIGFEEAQKQTRERVARLMDGRDDYTWDERELQHFADPRDEYRDLI